MNNVYLIGQLVNNPILHETGSVSASFTLAVIQHENSRKTESRLVDFVDCLALGETAKTAAGSLIRGQMVEAEGHIRVTDWYGSDGKPYRNTEIICDTIVNFERPQDTLAENTDGAPDSNPGIDDMSGELITDSTATAAEYPENDGVEAYKEPDNDDDLTGI